MIVKVIIINGIIISAILGVVYFSQQKNSQVFAGDFYKKAVESNPVAKKTDDWLNETFYKKAQQEAEKRQEIAKESMEETVESAKKGLLDSLYQYTVGNISQAVQGVGDIINDRKEQTIEKISNSFCSAQK